MNKKERQNVLYDYLMEQNGWVTPLTVVSELACYQTLDTENKASKGYCDLRHDIKDINTSLQYPYIIATNNPLGYKLATSDEAKQYKARLVTRLKSLLATMKIIDAKIKNNNQLTGLDADNLDIVQTFWEDPEKTPDWLIDELMKGIMEND